MVLPLGGTKSCVRLREARSEEHHARREEHLPRAKKSLRVWPLRASDCTRLEAGGLNGGLNPLEQNLWSTAEEQDGGGEQDHKELAEGRRLDAWGIC